MVVPPVPLLWLLLLQAATPAIAIYKSESRSR
jgi:hypothetical protein